MKVESIRPGTRDALQRIRYFASHLFLPLLIGSLLVADASAQTAVGKGSVEGAAFTLDSEGRSYVPGAKVTLQAPKPLQTETDEKGQYSFHDLEPGQYTVVAAFPGLQAEEEITITAGVELKVELELKPVSVQTGPALRLVQRLFWRTRRLRSPPQNKNGFTAAI